MRREAVELRGDGGGAPGAGGALFSLPESVAELVLSAAESRRQGKPEAALALFSRAVELDPGRAELYNNLGVILQDLGRFPEAVNAYQKAVKLRPIYCEARCNLANTLVSLGRTEEALGSYRLAIAANPGYPDAYYNQANALCGERRWQEAVERYQELLRVAPAHLPGWVNLAGSLLMLNRFADAIKAARRALGCDPGAVGAHFTLALALLATGEYREGWREYEWRLKDEAVFPVSCLGRPRWDGSPLGGRILLVRAEQGFGDAIQFYRYARLLADSGARVVLECRPELFPLLSSQPGPLQLVVPGEPPPPFDTFAYAMSLPFLLGATLADLPAAVPYLVADPRLTSVWRGRLKGGGGLKVGIVWAGSSGYRLDRDRSLPLTLLAPLFRIPGIEFYALQMGEAAKEIPPEGVALRDLTPQLQSFADTAAIIANLDLVISVDTAVAHLAGALGRRVLMMLPYSSDWRWLSGRGDSPWYPTLRLYRQKEPGEWGSVLAEIGAFLTGELEPADLNSLFREANRLGRAGRFDEAVGLYRRLLSFAPGSAEIRNNLGIALQQAGRLDLAHEAYREALRLNPQLADAWNSLGTVLVSRGELAGALPLFERAIALRDDFLPPYINVGSLLQQLERPEDALPYYRRALALQPDSLEAHINLGTAFQDMMRPEQAVTVYRELLEQDPLLPAAHWNLALSLLSMGEFASGWREYEWRFRWNVPTLFPGPVWDGCALDGESILVWCEQGLGDTLQFIRYLPLVAALGGCVLVLCQSASLKPLVAGVKGVAAVYAPGEELPPFKHHVPLLSLPRIFGTTLGHLPAACPYVRPDPGRVALWQARLNQESRFKVGLIWKGGALPRNRACPFDAFAPLAKLSGVAFFSLQLGEAPTPGVLPLVDLSPGIGDFADSAAIMAHLDLVITVDTAGAHLAGGMGVPVWTMLPKGCDWRWLHERADSPWYPSMRIFRQQGEAGDWSEVMERICASLLEVAGGGRLSN